MKSLVVFLTLVTLWTQAGCGVIGGQIDPGRYVGEVACVVETRLANDVDIRSLTEEISSNPVD